MKPSKLPAAHPAYQSKYSLDESGRPVMRDPNEDTRAAMIECACILTCLMFGAWLLALLAQLRA